MLVTWQFALISQLEFHAIYCTHVHIFMHICVSVNKCAEIDRIWRRSKVCKCWKRNPTLTLGICCARYKPRCNRYGQVQCDLVGQNCSIADFFIAWWFLLCRVSTVPRVSISVCVLSLFVSVFFDCLPQFAITVGVGVQLGWSAVALCTVVQTALNCSQFATCTAVAYRRPSDNCLFAVNDEGLTVCVCVRIRCATHTSAGNKFQWETFALWFQKNARLAKTRWRCCAR